MSPTKRKSIPVTTYFITLIGRSQWNGRFCWQASLLHLRPSFSSTRMITRTIYVQDLSSGTLLLLLLIQSCPRQLRNVIKGFSKVGVALGLNFLGDASNKGSPSRPSPRPQMPRSCMAGTLKSFLLHSWCRCLYLLNKVYFLKDKLFFIVSF